MTVGTLQTSDHPAWEGMLADNANGQPITDWKIADGGGHDWVAEDGGMIDGGDRYMDIFNYNNVTGRVYWRFADFSEDNALPTDIGEATSVYLRYTITYKSFDNPTDTSPDADGPTIITRFNGSWSFKTAMNSKARHYIAGSTEHRFFYEIEKDLATPAGNLNHVFLEDHPRVGPKAIDTVYLAVTRYDFDDSGVLVGVAAWVNPNYDSLAAPDVEAVLPDANQYDTFVNPLLSLDMTVYNGHMTFDNIVIAKSWDDVVPMAADTDPLIGGTPVDGLPGWYLSDWFGYYNTDLAPWVFHAQHGWLYRDPPSTNASTFFYDDKMTAWWYTNETDYPFVYGFGVPADNAGTVAGDAWLWYFEGTKTPRNFGVVTGAEAGNFLYFNP
jgi:hypothetical protein